jgi:integrase
MSLTDTRIRNAKKQDKPYKLTDAKGLYVEVRPSGAKFFRYRFRIDRKETIYTVGEYVQAPNLETAAEAQTRRAGGQYTLEEARQERIRVRGLVKQGISPTKEKRARVATLKAESGNTFEVVAKEWLEKNRPHWTVRHHGDVLRTLENDVFPHVGALPTNQVTAAMILDIMDRVAKGGTATRKRGAPVVAINVRQWCSGIFAHAVRTLRADGDPTGVLKGHIRRPKVKNKTPLTKDGIKDLVHKIEGSGYLATRFALKLLLYMFVRPGELRQAEWSEFDLERAVWTIPGEKMKKGERHLVPLSNQVVQLLRALQLATGGRTHLFPNQRRPNDHISGNALNAALSHLGYKGQFTAHGFRATASTELHEVGYRSEVIELQLAHADRDQTRASYNQAQFWDERKAMMQQWADLVDAWAAGDKVVAIKGRAA